ncbi:hypothetical protein OG596_12210 [Streptomyces sp. NBC_01102]|uniref:hypothetical protein n=1 Tax=Streptomyces sp. NBC_01102 TaxID=2903749 RepID=UPI003868CC13|nr:hypothetical protein OG596_12210 [Streptomyces sp. NBC_01102]
MTMPPQPPQDPYGSPQPQQNPYGQQQPPGSPYPQQPPAYGNPTQPPAGPYPQQPSAYGHPQQTPAYGYPAQPPQGPPGAWGQPGAQAMWPQQPQPPRKKRSGLVVGIVAGALVGVLAIGFGAYKLIDAGADAVFPEATHKLVVEKAVLDGEFTLNKDMSDTEGKKIEDTPDPSIRDGKAVVAQYGSQENGMLVLSGMYGRLSSPELMRSKMMEGAAEAEGATVPVPPKEFKPAGYDITVECQVVQSKEIGLTTNSPMCAWSDGNTAGMVAVLRPDDLSKDAKSLDLAKTAEETAKVRSEIRKPIG